ncbi:uncharacterized protein LOC116805963 [Drosophila grimshawi]|uniref:uncharacterized protein LOC116805963 n=1 Tax=Drosophila grimshawi TaxID=7222 RepID=UPI000C870841|nr:uncharacterized protein LOC116805963 [Drosophila grimshawi]
MSIIIKGAGYMALIYEGFNSALGMVGMVYFASLMKYDMVDVMILIGEMFKLICFGILAVGVISRSKMLVKLWLLTSYVQIKWDAVGLMFHNIYEFYFTEKYNTTEEFLEDLSHIHGSILGQVLSRIGIILLIYRYYLLLKKEKAQVDQKAAEQKAK